MTRSQNVLILTLSLIATSVLGWSRLGLFGDDAAGGFILDDLFAHYMAESALNVFDDPASDGGLVTTWPVEAPTASTWDWIPGVWAGANKPEFVETADHGRSSLLFNGTSTGMMTDPGNFINAVGYTYYAVVSLDTTEFSTYMCAAVCNDSATYNKENYIVFTADSEVFGWRPTLRHKNPNLFTYDETQVPIDITASKWYAVCVVINDWDDVEVLDSEGDTGINIETDLDRPPQFGATTPYMALGVNPRDDGITGWWDGEISEVVIYDVAHTVAERTRMINYLKEKYSL